MRILINILFIISYVSVGAQSPSFEYQRLLPDIEQKPTFSFEDDNGDFIISTKIDSNTGLVKLDNEGNLIETTVLNYPGFVSHIWHIFEQEDKYISLGTISSSNPDSAFAWIVEYDLDLTIRQENRVFIDNFKTDWFYQCNTQYPDTLICVGQSDISYSPIKLFAYKFMDIDNIEIIDITQNYRGWTVDIIIPPANPNKYYVHAGNNAQVFDANFNHLNTVEYPFAPWQPTGDYHPLSDSTFLVCGKQVRYGVVAPKIGIAILDYDLNVVSYDSIGHLEGIRDVPADTKSVDVFDDFIYAGGTSNSIGPGTGEINSHFILGKFENDLEEKWIRYYGGDAYYFMSHLHATKDGGCFMIGTKHDFIKDPGITQLYVLKVNEDGDIITTTTIPFEESKLTIYPNPTTHELVVELSSMQYAQSANKVTLYDLIGRKVLEKEMDADQLVLDLSNLTSATYFLVVKNEDGEVIAKEEVVKVEK